MILTTQNLRKEVPSGENNLVILDDITFGLEEGKSLAITGPSGSGKSTLLGLMAGLDTASSGEIILDGIKLHLLNEEERAILRKDKVGFVFQSFELLPSLTALENVMLPAELKSEKNPKDAYGIMKLAGEVVTEGLCRLHNIPYTIIRPSAVYGPKDMNRRVSQIFIENAFKKQEISIQGKNEKLDFTYIKDLANGSILAARKKKGLNQIFNITCGKGQTLFSYVSYLKSEFPELKYVI